MVLSNISSIRFTIILSALFLLSGAFAQEQAMLDSLTSTLSFRNVGPTRGGRVTAVAGHTAQTAAFYMGSTGGGVWKTQDYGQSWKNTSDGYFETGSIGAISIAPSDSDIVYVGTGSDGIRSNVIIGKGVYKSTDAGKTWEHLGLRNAGQIGAVIIHPENPDIVMVAAIGNPFKSNPERGIFRTMDGGLKPGIKHSLSATVLVLSI